MEGIGDLMGGFAVVLSWQNLLYMVIVGGYETFVSKISAAANHPDRPDWLGHIDANLLKIKLAISIVTISSIHLLKSFIEVGMVDGLPLCSSLEGIASVKAMAEAGLSLKACTTITATGVLWQTIIHSVFIISALGIAWTDKLMTGAASKREKEAHANH